VVMVQLPASPLPHELQNHRETRISQILVLELVNLSEIGPQCELCICSTVTVQSFCIKRIMYSCYSLVATEVIILFS
jgi:hypothetical protein